MILDGAWRFRFDDQDEGLRSGWMHGLETAQKIVVPFAYQTQKSGIDDQKRHDIIWYEQTFLKPEKERTVLHFEGSDYQTSVWLNGTHLGDEEGGYHRFSFDVTPHLQEGLNTLVLRVLDTKRMDQVRGKQRWKEKNFECWYVETSGLWKTVWLEFLPKLFIESIKAIPSVSQKKVALDIELNEYRPGLTLQVILSKGHVQNVYCLELQQRDTRHEIDLLDMDIALWTPDQPNIYGMEYILFDAETAIDRSYSYTTFREFKTEGNRILLNGNELYLKMLLDQGYWPDTGLTATYDRLIEDIEVTKAMGFNGIRKHQKIEDERFYYLADAYGLFVWLEMPSNYAFTKKGIAAFEREWLDIVDQYVHYPSIMAYVIFNESWGIPDVYDDEEQQLATVRLYERTKAIDRTRFIISNDGWEHTKSDLVTIHNYLENGDDLKRIYQDIDRILAGTYEGKTHTKPVFAKGYAYAGQPVIMSEYGGIAFQGDQGWGYGQKVTDQTSYHKRLKGLTDAIFSIDTFSGYCLTQTTDVEQETNGVMTPEREPKLPVVRFKSINRE